MQKSYWIENSMKDRKVNEKLDKNIETEVCVIGAGLTGLTTAYYLAKEGKKVVVLEKDHICEQASGNTTAKITSQHGLFYKYLLDSLGFESAKEYLEANEEAIKNIENIIKEEKIECDFKIQDSFVFTTEDDLKIKKEYETLKKLGFDAEYVKKIDLPIDILGAVKFKNQAQFNPCKYALGLENAIKNNDGEIYENTKVYDIKSYDDKYKIITENNYIIAKHVVMATHYPIINAPGFYFMKMYQETSYLIAIEKGNISFNGIYISGDYPIISCRMADDYIIVGGCGHRTGENMDLSNMYNILENRAREIFGNCRVKYKWNTEDCISLDKIPYIGEFSNLMPNVYVGTGYKKWGMTSSNVAANIISKKILGKATKYEEVFTSTRLKPLKNYKELGNMIKEASYSLIINKLKDSNEHLQNLKKDEGAIIEIDGVKLGAYRDNNGHVYVVKPICTHLGCELSWNNLDKTWDCPCHGSRFDYTGKSIYNPALKDLERLD